jgi:hypothetical protein
MYGHPRKSDPYAKVQEIPPYRPSPIIEAEREFCVIACMLVALPAGAVAFMLGYFGSAWGWF